MSVKSVFLVLTSAIGLDGVIAKAGDLIEVAEQEAAGLLARGKARLATAEDGVDEVAEGITKVVDALDPVEPDPAAPATPATEPEVNTK